MKITTSVTVAWIALFPLSTLAQPREERHEERREEHHVEVHRAPPPRFQAHAPGVHPHRPAVRPHAVRVMAPRIIGRGNHFWARWAHPEFARPTYYWDWGLIHTVSCIAEDSYGDQYPVSQATWPGFGLEAMTTVEDEALNRCYAESGGDPSCYLATCSHF